MTDAISRSALRETLNKFKLSDDCMKHEWAIQAADDVAKYTIAAIKNAPALDVAPVVHEKDIRSSVITVKDSDEWQDRIILADESTQVCAVYYADDSELAPVVHARWQDHHCTKCKNEAALLYECIGDDEGFAWFHSDFCPCCGAKMDGEENG